MYSMAQPRPSMPKATGSIPSTIFGLLQQVYSKRAKHYLTADLALQTLQLHLAWSYYTVADDYTSKQSMPQESEELRDLTDFRDDLKYKEKFGGRGVKCRKSGISVCFCSLGIILTSLFESMCFVLPTM